MTQSIFWVLFFEKRNFSPLQVGACGLFLLLIFMTLLVCALRFTGFCNSSPMNTAGARNNNDSFAGAGRCRSSTVSPSTCVVLPPFPPPSYSELQIDKGATKVVDYYRRCRITETAEDDRKENNVGEEVDAISTSSSAAQENIKVILMWYVEKRRISNTVRRTLSGIF